MKRLLERRRLALFFSLLGVALMGIDLLLTRSFFTHVGELMIASLLCLAAGILLDLAPGKSPRNGAGSAGGES